MNRIGWSIFLVFGAVLVLYLPMLLNDNDTDIAPVGDPTLVPNYQAVNLRSQLYDEDGRLSHQVAADKMEHFDDLGFAVFENPVYTLFLDDGEPWEVIAQEGTLYNNNRIQLEKGVKITNLRSDEYVKEITTEYIEIDIEQKTLSSTELVTISGINYDVTSIGLFGNLSTQQYEFKEHVQTKFNPVR